MNHLKVNPIGTIAVRDGEKVIELEEKFIPALTGLEGFGYVQIIWWFDKCDNQESRLKLTEESPYKRGPKILGTFATRSPERPNPIALSTAYVTYIDFEKGVIGLSYIDADEGSMVLDLKPYTPSIDRVEHIIVPEWCSNWPKSNEASGDFDWSQEFNF